MVRAILLARAKTASCCGIDVGHDLSSRSWKLENESSACPVPLGVDGAEGSIQIMLCVFIVAR